MRDKKPLVAVVIALLFTFAPSLAEDSGFLSDYSKLDEVEGDLYFKSRFIVPGALEMLSKYHGIMIDQPEIFLSPDSKYKGAKPDSLKVLADSMRAALIERFEGGGFNVVEEAGPGVGYFRWAVTDLYLKKKSRKFYAYTPIGFVVDTTAKAIIQDAWKKVDIVEMNVEAEFLDSQSNEVLAAVILSQGQRKDKEKDLKRDLVTWEEQQAMMQTVGARLRCHFVNIKIPQDKRMNCQEITITAEEK